MIRSAIVALHLIAGATAGDWPHFLGPSYNAASSETGLLKEWPKDGPPKLWEHATGAGHPAPAVVGGRAVIFYGSQQKEVIECLDVADGKPVWKVAYDAPYTPQFGGGSGPATNPTVAQGNVFTLGITGVLHCLELSSGKVLWKRELAQNYRLLPTFFGQGGTPLVIEDRVIVPLGTEDRKSLVAFDASSGKELWAAVHPWGASYASPVPARIHGRQCVLAFQGGMDDPPTGGVLVVDAADGKVLSAVPHRAQMYASVSISSPVTAENLVFVSEAYTEGGLCVQIEPDFSAKVLWKAPKFDTYIGTALAHDGHLYGAAGQHQRNAELACYRIADGKEMWRDDLGGAFQRTSLLKADGAFLALGENGDLAWIELSPSGPKIKSQAKLFHAPETWAPPVISDGRLFVSQCQPGAGGTRPRLICYQFKP